MNRRRGGRKGKDNLYDKEDYDSDFESAGKFFTFL